MNHELDNTAKIKALRSISDSLSIDYLSFGEEQLLQLIVENLNHLIDTNFNKLVQILYRLDIDEKKVKTVLKENPDKQAGPLLAQLIIERQMEKLRSRQDSGDANDIPEDEKW